MRQQKQDRTIQALFICVTTAMMWVGCAEEDAGEDAREPSASHSHRLDDETRMACEPGYIPYRIPETRLEDTYSEEFRERAGERLELEPAYLKQLDIRAATCPGGDEAKDGVELRVLRAACGNETSCVYTTTQCDAALQVAYTCGAWDNDASGATQVRSAAAAKITPDSGDTTTEARWDVTLDCPEPPEQTFEGSARVECIPAECHGRARRNLDMQCELAPDKKEVALRVDRLELRPIHGTLHSQVDESTGERKLEISPAGAYDIDFKVTFGFDMAPEHVRFTAWLEDEYEQLDAQGNPLNSGTVRVMRCSPFSFVFRKDDPSVKRDDADHIFQQTVRVDMGKECFTKKVAQFMADDAAKQFGTHPTLVRPVHNGNRSSPLVARSRLSLAYDLEGKTVWHEDMVPEDTFDGGGFSQDFFSSVPACAPNPVEFYYQQTQEGARYDLVSYFAQRELPDVGATLEVSPLADKRAEIGPLSMTLETPSIYLKISEPQAFDRIRADIAWYVHNMMQDLSQTPLEPWKTETFSHRFLPTYQDDLAAIPYPARLEPNNWRPWAPRGFGAHVYLVKTGLTEQERQNRENYIPAGAAELRWEDDLAKLFRFGPPEVLPDEYNGWRRAPLLPLTESIDVGVGGSSVIDKMLEYADPSTPEPSVEFDVLYCIESFTPEWGLSRGFDPIGRSQPEGRRAYSFYELSRGAKAFIKDELVSTCQDKMRSFHDKQFCDSYKNGCYGLRHNRNICPDSVTTPFFRCDGKLGEDVCEYVVDHCFEGGSSLRSACDKLDTSSALVKLEKQCEVDPAMCAPEFRPWELVLEDDQWRQDNNPDEPWRVRGCRVAPLPITATIDRFRPSVPPVKYTAYGGFSRQNSGEADDFEMQLTSQNTMTCEDSSETRCVNGTSVSTRSGGAISQTIFNVRTDSERDLAQAEAEISGKAVAEVLGFQVFDSGPLLERESLTLNFSNDVVSVEAGKDKVTLKLVPPWEPVVEFLNRTRKNKKMRWIQSDFAETSGIGLGVSVEKQIKLVNIVTTLAAGVSIAAEFVFKFAPEEPNPCLDKTEPCYVAHPKATYHDARETCRRTGGRLAELSTSEEALAVEAKEGEDVIWLDAPLYYYQANRRCALEGSTIDLCLNQSFTSFRWQTTREEFARQNGQGGVSYFSSKFFVANSQGLSSLYPRDAVATFDKKTKSFGAATLDEERAFICRHEPLEQEMFVATGAAIKLGAGASFQGTGCVPSNLFGGCLQLDVNFISIGLTPGFEFARRWLMRDSNFNSFRLISTLKFEIPWTLKALAVKLQVLAKVVWFSINEVLFEYEGFEIDSGSLFETQSEFITDRSFP